VFQNFQDIAVKAPQHTLILAGDHIYKMKLTGVVEWYPDHKALINAHP
jgi:ADP-glucose pyrophosphorylase